MSNDLLNISLNQGKQFTTYQRKIKKHISKTDKLVNNKREGFVTLEQEQIVRPSFDGYSPVLRNIQQTTTLTNTANQKDLDELKQLQIQYDSLIQQYTAVQKKIGDSSINAINRLSSNNPYLNKTIRFTTGQMAYVTNEGVVKYIPSSEILDSVNISKNYIDINIPWDSSYNTTGTQIPTNPPLISGTNIKKGQTLGNEGSNVYASRLISNPSSSYIGCYNDKPPSTNVNVVPIMNVSNNVNSFRSIASSIYLQTNESVGPWAAFDQNPNTFWHSEISSANNYNAETGVYEGSNGVNIKNIGNIRGEFLQINLPAWTNQNASQSITVNQYSLAPRLDLITTRSPNSWYVLGWIDSEQQWYQVDRQQNQSFTSGTPKVYNVSSPGAYSAYLLLIDKVGNDDKTTDRYCVQVAEWNLFMNSDTSFTNDKRAMILNQNMIGYTSFDKCQEYAVENGYDYFGLQDVQSDGNATCLVSNDIARIKIYGDASKQTNVIPIWSSNTSTGGSNRCQLSGSGQLTITDSSGKVLLNVNPQVSECRAWGTMAIDSATYGGNCKVPIGNVTDKVGNDLKCNWSSNCSIPISNGTFGDPSPGCGKSFDVAYRCGGSSYTRNLAYAEGQTMILDCNEYMETTCQFHLILQSDGNLCIYKGKDPSDKQEGVWCAMTNGKQKSQNPDWVSSKGIFGRNYLKTGEGLGPDEWIGSDDGSLKLIMQKDGNLVLYTSESKSGCKVMNDKTYGGEWINAVYKMNNVGERSVLSKIGYVDSDSNLREYPDSMVGFINDYQIYQNTDSVGNDITSLVAKDSNDCKLACNKNSDCAAYVYQGMSQTCWLKNRAAFPKGEKQPNNNTELGVRLPGLKGSTTCSNKITNIDTIQYNNYLKGSAMAPDTPCNPSLVSQTDQLLFDNIKSQLITLGNDIVSKMETLYNQDNNIFTKLNTNAQQFKKDIENYKLTNLKIKQEFNLQTNNIEAMQNLNTNDLNGMLTDSDIRVLQENYRYIALSILAVGILTLTINTMIK
jgi:hypothetical protein